MTKVFIFKDDFFKIRKWFVIDASEPRQSVSAWRASKQVLNQQGFKTKREAKEAAIACGATVVICPWWE